uniref:Uncharacterized protein n=1 Tax=Panagrolaimus davidi TaxID=227884 RepID=A0A914QG42_9BILA
MADNYNAGVQKCIEKMQSLKESMEKTMNQHRENPKLACNNTALSALIQRAQNLYNEMDGCQKDVDGTIATLISDKTDAERKCEQQIKNLEETLEQGKKANENRQRNMEVSENISNGASRLGWYSFFGGFLFPPLMATAVTLAGLSTVAADAHNSEMKKGEVNLDEIRNRMQSQMDKKLSYQNQINAAKQSIERNQKDMEQLKIKIQDYETKIQKYLRMVSSIVFPSRPVPTGFPRETGRDFPVFPSRSHFSPVKIP